MSDSGRARVASLVPRGTLELLNTYVALLAAEASRQNLIAASTLDGVWERHILDSLQLIDHATLDGSWCDIGSGAGLPGIVVAIATRRSVVMIEPRKRRAAFLDEVASALALRDRVEIIAQRCERAAIDPPAVISARAVARLGDLFAMAEHFAGSATQWILPRGRGAAEEVEIARRTWQGEFQLAPSLTDRSSAIVVARDVRRRGQP